MAIIPNNNQGLFLIDAVIDILIIYLKSVCENTYF